MEVGARHQNLPFFIWSICPEEIDFGQLIASLSNDTHFDTITQSRIKVESVWHIVT